MRTISIQADKANDQIMTDWLAHLVLAIPVGGEGLRYSGLLRRNHAGRHPPGYRARVLFAPSVAVRGCRSGDNHGLPADGGQSVRFAVAGVAAIPGARLAVNVARQRGAGIGR
jgi:hypothetical protein